MLDGEMYGCVRSFCYLRDTVDGDGGENLAATARIRNGWMKFQELLPFLIFRAPPIEMKGRVYASCRYDIMASRSRSVTLWWKLHIWF